MAQGKLIRALHDGSPDVRTEAAHLLGEIGDEEAERQRGRIGRGGAAGGGCRTESEEDGPESGVYRVNSLARLNVSSGMSTPGAQRAYEELGSFFGGWPVHHTLAFHWARLVELLNRLAGWLGREATEAELDEVFEELAAYTDFDPEGAYSFVKAPRFDGRPMQVGPLARVAVWLAEGQPRVTELATQALRQLDNDTSTRRRYEAAVAEAKEEESFTEGQKMFPLRPAPAQKGSHHGGGGVPLANVTPSGLFSFSMMVGLETAYLLESLGKGLVGNLWSVFEAEFTPRNVATKEERVNTYYAVEIRLPNPDRALKPGMPADARIEIEDHVADVARRVPADRVCRIDLDLDVQPVMPEQVAATVTVLGITDEGPGSAVRRVARVRVRAVL